LNIAAYKDDMQFGIIKDKRMIEWC